MKTDIVTFNHEMFGAIRTTTNEQGEPLFVGKDVATALGYTNPAKALRDHIDEEDKLSEQFVLSGQRREAVLITESGLYSLVLSSKLPQAKVFKRWVTSEVLPQIRKTGGYIPTKDAEGRKLTDVEIMALAMKIQQRTIDMQQHQIEDLAPKAEYLDEVLASVSCFTTTQVAKELDMTVHDLTRLLTERKVMYWQSGQYLLYADYAREGFARNRTHTFRDLFGDLHTRTYLVWTERGRRFLHHLVKLENYKI